MWWTGVKGGLFPHVKVKEHSFYASGYRGHRIIVLPYRNLVIVHRVDTDTKNVDIRDKQIGRLLWFILAAARAAEIGEATFIEAADGVRLAAGNLYETLAGSTVWNPDRGERYVAHPDGTMTYFVGGGLRDTGKWWTEGDTLCLQWKNIRGGKKDCYFLVLDGTALKWFDLDGTLVGKGKLSRG